MTLTESLAENDTATRRGTGNPAISLGDLKSRRVPVEWFEAVAIVQELCRALLESRVVPDKTSLGARNVFIEPAGSVRFAQNTSEKSEPAIRQIGELLRTSVTESAFPVPLRLVINQASSTPPFYGSIAELSNALEYFERPDRAGLVRAVYERAQGYQPVSDLVNQTAPRPEDEKPARAPKRQPRRIPRSALLASAAGGAAIVVWLVASQLSTAAVADQPKKNAAGALTEIASSMGALVDRVNPFTTSSSPQAPNPAPDASNASAESLPRGSASASGGTRRSSANALQPAAGVVTLQVADASSGDTLLASDATDAIPAEAFATEGTVDAAVDTMIYSANDQDVTPPVAEYPRLPASPPPSMRAESLSTLELLVDETGEVESVRLRERPKHLGEALLVTVNLSAAKTWRFLPALKDGRPVRYRKLVQVWPTTE